LWSTFVSFLHRIGGIDQFFVFQGTAVEGVVTELFAGKMKIFIEYVNFDYESSRIEKFNGEKGPEPSGNRPIRSLA